MTSIRIVLLLLLASLAACRSTDDALRSAQSFVDEHYVTMDLTAAREHTTGVATRKVEEEQQLIEGQAIDQETLKPRVHYRLLERRPESDTRVSFLFEGEARVEELVFNRKWLVTVSREGEAWKVSNFQEYD